MAQKTKRERKGRGRSRSRSRSHSRIRRRNNEHEPESETRILPILELLRQGQGQGQGQGQAPHPIVEKHHFHSKMFFDGNTMFTESQKDNEPVKRRKYTLKRLEREIPIGAELVKRHLRRKVPPAVNAPFPKDIEFTSVLPNPIDLGLMPPSMSRHDHHDHDHDHHDYMKKRRKRSKHHDHDHDHEENIKLLVNELS
jgi:ABC-type nickel/cobalt efflux system permease component RcnA